MTSPDANDAARLDQEAYRENLDKSAKDTPPPENEQRPPTQGELLVGYSFNPSGNENVNVAKMRGAMSIDTLLNLPLRTRVRPDGGQVVVDPNHHLIVMEAVKKQIEATMWAVKALTWTGE